MNIHFVPNLRCVQIEEERSAPATERRLLVSRGLFQGRNGVYGLFWENHRPS